MYSIKTRNKLKTPLRLCSAVEGEVQEAVPPRAHEQEAPESPVAGVITKSADIHYTRVT